MPKYFKQVEINLYLVTISEENIFVPMTGLILPVVTLPFSQFMLYANKIVKIKRIFLMFIYFERERE